MPAGISVEARDLVTRLLKKNPYDRMKLEEILDHPFLAKRKGRRPNLTKVIVQHTEF